MGRLKYQPGDEIGEWRVVKYAGNGKYTCKCSCGNERDIRADSLSSGNSKSCGHKKEEDKKSWIGRKFGEWTVIGYLETGVVLCECSCGLQKKQYISTLTRGLSKSCGHSRFIGQRFGKLVVISRVDNSWQVNTASKHLCRCDCGKTVEHFTSNLTAGYVHSCGCDTNRSQYEYDIIEELNLNPEKFERNAPILEREHTGQGSKNWDIDIYFEGIKTGIEFNGDYWHSDERKPKNYHAEKTRLATEQGIRLIHIYEHEWINNREKVKKYLIRALGGAPSIGARKCTIAAVGSNEARAFEDKHHLQGSRGAAINIGLYRGEELVGLMTFGKSRYNKEYQYEMIRLTYGDINVAGGTERMFKYFIDNYDVESIITYADKSKFTGSVYERIGMVKQEDTPPNYKYVKRSTVGGIPTVEVLSREMCQKHKLIEKGFGHLGGTEYEIMRALKYHRIHDAGNYKFTWNRE